MGEIPENRLREMEEEMNRFEEEILSSKIVPAPSSKIVSQASPAPIGTSTYDKAQEHIQNQMRIGPMIPANMNHPGFRPPPPPPPRFANFHPSFIPPQVRAANCAPPPPPPPQQRMEFPTGNQASLSNGPLGLEQNVSRSNQAGFFNQQLNQEQMRFSLMMNNNNNNFKIDQAQFHQRQQVGGPNQMPGHQQHLHHPGGSNPFINNDNNNNMQNNNNNNNMNNNGRNTQNNNNNNNNNNQMFNNNSNSNNDINNMDATRWAGNYPPFGQIDPQSMPHSFVAPGQMLMNSPPMVNPMMMMMNRVMQAQQPQQERNMAEEYRYHPRPSAPHSTEIAPAAVLNSNDANGNGHQENDSEKVASTSEVDSESRNRQDKKVISAAKVVYSAAPVRNFSTGNGNGKAAGTNDKSLKMKAKKAKYDDKNDFIHSDKTNKGANLEKKNSNDSITAAGDNQLDQNISTSNSTSTPKENLDIQKTSNAVKDSISTVISNKAQTLVADNKTGQREDPASTSKGPTAVSKKKQAKDKKDKKKKFVRMAAGSIWEDTSLGEWDQDDFRLFCGDLGNEVTDDVLSRVFSKYPSFRKARVVRDKRSNKTKGYGFASFKDPNDFMKAMRDLNGKYVGNRPIKLRKSCWTDRQIDNVKKKDREKKKLGFR